MADVSKRLEKAEKYLQKGKMESALEEYQDILKDEPNHDGARQAAADICVSLNRPGDAAKLLGPLFDRQAAANDAAKAGITYKKLQRFTTPNWWRRVPRRTRSMPTNWPSPAWSAPVASRTRWQR